MSITEKSLNHLLTGAIVLQISTYPEDGGLHILFENGATLTIYARDYLTLRTDILGPPVAESPNVERQVEAGP